MTTPITNREDVIDTRDLIARIKDLQETLCAINEDLEEATANHKELSTPETLIRKEQAQLALEEFSAEARELASLLEVQAQAEHSSNYLYGEQLIAASYFVKYTEQLIEENYDMSKDLQSGHWPWRHMAIDYEAAAGELQQDYTDVAFGDTIYWIRA